MPRQACDGGSIRSSRLCMSSCLCRVKVPWCKVTTVYPICRTVLCHRGENIGLASAEGRRGAIATAVVVPRAPAGSCVRPQLVYCTLLHLLPRHG